MKRYLLAIGVILSSFIFDLIDKWFKFIPALLVRIVFWVGIGILILLILMEVIHWIIEFIKTEAQNGRKRNETKEQSI